MDALAVIMPVIVMIVIGMVCKKYQFLNRQGIDNIKFLVTKIMLPAAIFNALASVEYDSQKLVIIMIMLVMLLISFGIGYILKPLMKEPYKRYLPFMVSVYEGGMIAYPLFINLCGSENMPQIALLDIAGLLFGFSVYMGLLEQVNQEGKVDIKGLCVSAIKNPAFIAAVLGVLCGCTGVIARLTATSFGNVYESVISIITVPLSSMILIAVGYDFSCKKKYMAPCIKTVLIRFVLQIAMTAGVLFSVHLLGYSNDILDIAIITYMSAPATFSMQSFVKNAQDGEYVATANSMYCVISFAVYAVLAWVYI